MMSNLEVFYLVVPKPFVSRVHPDEYQFFRLGQEIPWSVSPESISYADRRSGQIPKEIALRNLASRGLDEFGKAK